MAHETTKRTYYIVFAVLMALLVVTVGAAYINWGSRISIVIAMAIAITKAVLVVLYFMHVKGSSGLTKVFVMAGFAWVALLLGITLIEYYTPPRLRGEPPMTGVPPERG